MSFGSRYGREVVRCFIKDTKERHGMEVNEAELNGLAEAGKIELDTYGMIPDEDQAAVVKWVAAGRPDPSTWGECTLFEASKQDTSFTPPGSGGASGDAGDRLLKLTQELMVKEKLSYGVAFDRVQRKNPELARQVSEGLDAYRHRNDPKR